MSDQYLRSLVERLVWECVQRPPDDPRSFLSASLHQLAPDDEQRLDAILAELEASGRAAELRAQKHAPPLPVPDPGRARPRARD
jgi:hypothetical protein